jgi:hypothetical protein
MVAPQVGDMGVHGECLPGESILVWGGGICSHVLGGPQPPTLLHATDTKICIYCISAYVLLVDQRVLSRLANEHLPKLTTLRTALNFNSTQPSLPCMRSGS